MCVGSDVAMQLNNYIRDVFFDDTLYRKRDTRPWFDGSKFGRRRREKAEYARVQLRFQSRQSGCAREILYGTPDVRVGNRREF